MGTGVSLSPRTRYPKKTNVRFHGFLPLAFFILLALCNIHLFTSGDASILSFDKAEVTKGQWWRILTHPFVHVSWYHLLLDSAAVVLLWSELRLSSQIKKVFVTLCCAAGGLAIPVLSSSTLEQYGLCGLSGTAHGLMFFLGLWWITESRNFMNVDRWIRISAGILFAGISAGKSIIETVTGTVMFASMHAGDLGVPIVESHLGGVLGGLVAFCCLSVFRNPVPFSIHLKSGGNQ